ncbi:MAG TPA: hypothetical protein PK359_20425 [Burkholderiaceae bacterium]|nr:hypothetical protein [Burkholderiaceae bacterium]
MRSTVTIAHEPLTTRQQHSLRALAGEMVPPSDAFGVPGADDDRIFADIVASLGRDTPQVALALARLDEWAGGHFGGLPVGQQQALTQRLRDEAPALALALVNTVVRCYYRDDRVMRSLNMEVRAPFPKGFALEQGDWSLLDPVRARGKAYRDAE